jgi:hypothetical protein
MGPVANRSDLIDCEDQSRFNLVVSLMERFSCVFCDIDFSLDWKANNLNASATFLNGRMGVVLWGGLARHRALGEDGLAVALAHEVGHHLGGRPFDPDYPWISSEGQADYWATLKGMKRAFKPNEEGVSRSLAGAGELMALYRCFYRPWRPSSRARRSGPFRLLSPRCRWLTLKAGALGNKRPRCACS